MNNEGGRGDTRATVEKIKTQRRKESYVSMGKEMKREGSCQGMV
jgi:hypothetical protein